MAFGVKATFSASYLSLQVPQVCLFSEADIPLLILLTCYSETIWSFDISLCEYTSVISCNVHSKRWHNYPLPSIRGSELVNQLLNTTSTRRCCVVMNIKTPPPPSQLNTFPNPYVSILHQLVAAMWLNSRRLIKCQETMWQSRVLETQQCSVTMKGFNY